VDCQSVQRHSSFSCYQRVYACVLRALCAMLWGALVMRGILFTLRPSPGVEGRIAIVAGVAKGTASLVPGIQILTPVVLRPCNTTNY